MRYAKEQLEVMSDFEINKALCLKLGLDVSGVDEQRNMMTGVVLDFCKTWNYIMPLAVEYGVATIVEEGVLVGATTDSLQFYESLGDVVYSFMCNPPQRAIACCLLMMELNR